MQIGPKRNVLLCISTVKPKIINIFTNPTPSSANMYDRNINIHMSRGGIKPVAN